MSKAEVYALARLKGLGTRSAAREAGFADGRPSPQARDLWRRVQALRTTPNLERELEAERAKLATQRARLDRVEEAHTRWRAAVTLLERWSLIDDHPT